MSLARRLQTLLLVTLVVPGHACLVTSAPSYSAVECPPSFLNNEADPSVGEPRKYDINDTTAPLEFSGTVPIRSCSVANKLFGRVFFDNNLAAQMEINETGTTIRTARLTLPLKGKERRCHKIEFLVTNEWANGGDFRTPKKQGDLASIIWWIDVTDGPWHSLDTCPKSPTSE